MLRAVVRLLTAVSNAFSCHAVLSGQKFLENGQSGVTAFCYSKDAKLAERHCKGSILLLPEVLIFLPHNTDAGDMTPKRGPQERGRFASFSSA